jgi:hypothetical protein
LYRHIILSKKIDFLLEFDWYNKRQKNKDMGIKYLNRFLKENCTKKSIRKIQFNQIANKTVVIDTSIYMYRYIAEDALMENMYLLVSSLLSNNITPLFVFDGKPPPEKEELLKLRRLDKKRAEAKYDELSLEYNKPDVDVSNEEKQKMLHEMDSLKKKFVRLRDIDIHRVKSLLHAYGVMYYESVHEADDVCAYMVKTGKAWACVSDDMDMFVYGCSRVLRNVSLLNKTVILYDTSSIFNELCMTENTFREIMVLSGTDYNIKMDTNLDSTIEWYTKYTQRSPSYSNLTFYEWMYKTNNYITTSMEKLKSVCDLFTTKHIQNTELDNIDIHLQPKNELLIREIMADSGFVFT